MGEGERDIATPSGFSQAIRKDLIESGHMSTELAAYIDERIELKINEAFGEFDLREALRLLDL